MINSTAILIFWNPPPPIYQNGNITGYQVLVTDLNGNNFTANTTHTSYVAVDLQIHALYDFEVTAMTVIGIGPFSDPVSNQTFEDGQCT